MTDALAQSVRILADGRLPDLETLGQSFETLLGGTAAPEHVSAFLMGLKLVGETGGVLLTGARVMRAHARKITLVGPTLDTCGTGGLGWTSLNTSTASALVIAACGGRVAKHGNRSVPPKTGSADVLEALGVRLDIDEATFRRCVEQAGVGFLFARTHHSAMRHVAPIRAALGIRTVFNLLGPLTNPAGATHQVLGVFAPEWVRPMGEALSQLGVAKAWVVHGRADASGQAIDELSIAGETVVCEVERGMVREMSLTPEAAGLPRHGLTALAGGPPEDNAQAIRDLVEGRPGPFRDAVVLNAAAGLHVLGMTRDLDDGARQAERALDSGMTRETLRRLQSVSQGDDAG